MHRLLMPTIHYTLHFQLADELTAPRPEGEEKVEDIQVLLSSDAHAANLRELKVSFFY